MRNLMELNKYRVIDQKFQDLYGTIGDEISGAFLIPYKSNTLRIIASAQDGWDHISISLINRCPNWEEMEYIAKLFFKDTEYAVQYHVPSERHINIHPYCLHWWRPHLPEIILMPPMTFV
jgi:hypothetical protein